MTASPYWQVELRPTSRALDESVAAAVLNVFREGMGEPDGWHLEGAVRSVRGADLALYLVDADQTVGYAHYNAIAVPGDPLARFVLWEESICFLPAYQGRGFGDVALTTALLALEPNRSVGWIGGRTQNPIVFRRYQRFARSGGRLLPFRAAYDGDHADGAALEAVSSLFSAHWKNRPDRFGITPNAYREGKLGKYPERVRGGEGYERFLLQQGFNRDAGDAVIVLANTWSVLDDAPPDADESSSVSVTRLSALSELGSDVEDLTFVYQAIFADAPYSEMWDPAYVRESLDRYAKWGCLFVARLAARIVGFAAAGSLGEPLLGSQLPESVVRSVPVAGRERIYIDELGVVHDARRRGVAIALMQAVRRTYEADAQFVLGTHAANQASVALYRSLGFRLLPAAAYPTWATRTNGRLAADFRIALARG